MCQREAGIQSQRDSVVGNTRPPFLAFKMEGERVPKSVMQAASTSWKKQENGFSSRAPGKAQSPADTWILAQ